MSKVCERCGKRPVAGRSYARRGLAKKKGGVGRKITGITKRRFSPNVQVVRVRDEGGTVRRARLCTRCLRTGLRDGTIEKVVRKPRAPKPEVVPVEAARPDFEAELEAQAEEAVVAEAATEAPAEVPVETHEEPGE